MSKDVIDKLKEIFDGNLYRDYNHGVSKNRNIAIIEIYKKLNEMGLYTINDINIVLDKINRIVRRRNEET